MDSEGMYGMYHWWFIWPWEVQCPLGFLHRLCSTFRSQSVWQSERTLRLQDLVLTTIWSSKESLNHVKSYVNPTYFHWFMISIIESFWFEPQCFVRGSRRLSSALKPSKITSSGFPAASWDFWCSAEALLNTRICQVAPEIHVRFPDRWHLPRRFLEVSNGYP